MRRTQRKLMVQVRLHCRVKMSMQVRKQIWRVQGMPDRQWNMRTRLLNIL